MSWSFIATSSKLAQSPITQPFRSRLVPNRITLAVSRESQCTVAPASGTVTVYCWCRWSEMSMVLPMTSEYGSAGSGPSLNRFAVYSVRFDTGQVRTSSTTSPVGSLMAMPMTEVTWSSGGTPRRAECTSCTSNAYPAAWSARQSFTMTFSHWPW